MAGTGGVGPVILSLHSGALNQLPLRSGQTLNAVVTEDGLALLAGSVRIPLDRPTPFQPGQQVRAEVVESGERLQLRATAQPAGGVPGGEQRSQLPEVLVRVLQAFSALDRTESFARIIPPGFPAVEQAVRLLVNLFLTRPSTGGDLRMIAQLLEQAAAAGVISKALPIEAAALLESMLATSPDTFERALRHWVRQTSRSLEGRLASLVLSGNVAERLDAVEEGGLRALLARLRHDEALLRHLQERGQAGRFERALERLDARLTGAQLQNVRGAEPPYVFAELPFPADGPVRWAQIHFFGEGQGKDRFDPARAFVALQVETSRLGSIWITLGSAAGQFLCRLRTTEAAAAERLRAGAPALAEALRNALRKPVEVEVGTWDGDVIEATAALCHQLTGLDVSA